MKRLIAIVVFTLSFFSFLPTVGASSSVAQYAMKYEGAPYQFGGKTAAGFDCSGFIWHVFDVHGVSLPRTTETQYQVGQVVAKEDLRPGDIVFFANTYRPGVSHAGIYLGNDQFISAKNERVGVQIAELEGNPYWGPRYIGARRHVPVSAPTEIEGAVDEGFKTYRDVPAQHLAYEAIGHLGYQNVVQGYADQTFRPEALVTRGQAAAMLNRILQKRATQPVMFRDVGQSNPFARDIAAMNEAGILKGYENEMYGLNDPLTKGQLAVILDRAFAYSKQMTAISSVEQYEDVPFYYWMADAIYGLKAFDQTGMFQTATFEVGEHVTRATFSAATYSIWKR